MAFLDWFYLPATIISLVLGYISARGELFRIYSKRRLPMVQRDFEFYVRMNGSMQLQIVYLAESILTAISLGGAGVLLWGVHLMPSTASPPNLPSAICWITGLSIYLYSAFRLGRFVRATSRFDETRARLLRELESLQSSDAANSGNA